MRIALHIVFVCLTLYMMDERNLTEELLSSGAASEAAELLATPVKGIAGQVMITIM